MDSDRTQEKIPQRISQEHLVEIQDELEKRLSRFSQAQFMLFCTKKLIIIIIIIIL